MRSFRFLPLAILVLPAGFVSAGDGAPAGALTVATEAIPAEAGARVPPPDKSPQARQSPVPVELSPLGVAGEGTIGKTKVTLVRGEGELLTIAINDVAALSAKGTPTTGAGNRRTGTTWRYPGAKVGAATLNLEASETLAGWSGSLTVMPAAGEKATPALDLVFGGPGAPQASAESATGRLFVTLVRGEGTALTLAVSKAASPSVGQLTSSKPVVLAGKPSREGKTLIATRWSSDEIDLEGQKVRVKVSERLASLTLRATPAATRRGVVSVAGAPWVLCLVDGDLDGRFDSEDDLWWFGPAATAIPGGQLEYGRMFEATEPQPALAGGAAWRLVSVAADGTATVAPEAKPGTVEAYFERRERRVQEKRWFWKFALDRESIAAEAGLDLARPKAAASAVWHHVADFEAAKALAAKEGKPLLVDFMADWCVGCQRLDYFVYPDREVAAQLAGFTLVKMNIDLDPAKTFDGFADPDGKRWDSIPALVAIGPAGKPVEFTLEGPEAGKTARVNHLTFLPPERLAKGLAAVREAWEATAKGK